MSLPGRVVGYHGHPVNHIPWRRSHGFRPCRDLGKAAKAGDEKPIFPAQVWPFTSYNLIGGLEHDWIIFIYDFPFSWECH